MACLLQMAHGHQLKKVPYMAAVGGRVIARVNVTDWLPRISRISDG